VKVLSVIFQTCNTENFHAAKWFSMAASSLIFISYLSFNFSHTIISFKPQNLKPQVSISSAKLMFYLLDESWKKILEGCPWTRTDSLKLQAKNLWPMTCTCLVRLVVCFFVDYWMNLGSFLGWLLVQKMWKLSGRKGSRSWLDLIYLH